MGRKRLPKAAKKVGIAGKVSPPLKKAIRDIAAAEHRTESQTLELIIEESPRVKEITKAA